LARARRGRVFSSSSSFFFQPHQINPPPNQPTHPLNSGVGNVYEYKDGEEGGDGAAAAAAGGADGEALRALIGNNWIDPPKRERKRVATYNESDYYRQAMKLGGGGGGGPGSRGGGGAGGSVKLPKMPALQDFQFYDVKRITALYEKEAAYETHKHSLAEKERSARAQGASEDVVQAHLAPGPNDPQPLSEEEVAEKEALLAGGFANWNKKDFQAFLRACEKVREKKTQVGEVAAEVKKEKKSFFFSSEKQQQKNSLFVLLSLSFSSPPSSPSTKNNNSTAATTRSGSPPRSRARPRPRWPLTWRPSSSASPRSATTRGCLGTSRRARSAWRGMRRWRV